MPDRPALLDLMTELRERREPHALATVVEATGSTSAHPGDKALIDAGGQVLTGWVGGGCAEGNVRQTALEALGDGVPRLIYLDLDDEVLGTGMPCGGAMRVFVEPLLPPPALWVLGHGRVTEALCRFGATLGFRVIVHDTPAPDPLRYPDAAAIIGDDDEYARLQPLGADAVIIATQHKGDHLSAVRALRSQAGYVAIVASNKRAGLMRDFLRDEGFSDNELARLRAPAGLDLRARTPEEIAFAVMGEVVMLRRGGTGAPLNASAAARTPTTKPVRVLDAVGDT
ncbi:MAG: XshC-Cox1-family protein [Rhodospirillales bacterium]|nr:XshC-Cox1-family protein [Rhodospirillales bacterium]MDB5383934.1 XshC-Cox1-family protein [Rhodospirillales bacterium]